MALPKQVQAQLAEVEEIEKNITAQHEGKPDPKDQKGDPPDDPPKEKAKPQPETNDGSDDSTEEKQPKPKPAKPADDTPTDKTPDFEQMYRTLKGKYDAEVPRLNDMVRDLTSKVGKLADAQEAKEKAEAEKPKEPVSYVTDADREEFGDELIDVQRRVAREVAQEFESKIDAQAKVIDELREALKQTTGQVGQQGFAQRLQALVPDFADVDKDPRWIKWLEVYDPMLRAKRREAAQAAFNTGDAEAVADYVKLFKQSLSTADTEEAAARQSELEKQVTPPPNANPRSAAPETEGKVWNTRQADEAWAKIRTLNTRGKHAEADKLEAELSAAYLEGRIRA